MTLYHIVQQLLLRHAHMHGLIHDDRLRTCQSCLLGLMYALRVNVRS